MSRPTTRKEPLDLEREGEWIGRTMVLHRAGLTYVAGDRLPVYLPIGLDALDHWTEGGYGGPGGERRWRFTFGGGSTVAIVSIVERNGGVYCSCGSTPCGHRLAALAIATAEMWGDDYSTDQYAQFVDARRQGDE